MTCSRRAGLSSPARTGLRYVPLKNKPLVQEAPSGARPHGANHLRQGLRTLAYELTVAEARERDRIARDLHDEIGQILAVARFKVGELKKFPPEEQADHLDELAELLADAARATRTATFDLSSPALRLGLEEALIELAQRLSRTGGPAFHVDGHLPPLEWSEPVMWVLYRVTREMAINVQRHSHARQAWIRLAGVDDRLVITIDDDGIGIEGDWASRGASREGGFGLVSAYAQMEALGGTLVVESGPGSGTQATVSLPLSGACGP